MENLRTVPLASRIDSWGRWSMRTYMICSIGCLVGYSGLVLLGDFPGPYWLAAVLAAVLPLGCLGVLLPRRLQALRRGEQVIEPADPRRPPGLAGALSQLRWLLAVLGVFWSWPFFYSLATLVARLSPPTRFDFAIDALLPQVTETTPIYVTIYWFFIMPLLFGKRQEHLVALLRSYATLMLVCSAFYVIFPVEYPRSPLEVRHLGDWALAIVHTLDPPINCFPSSHCAVAVLAGLAMREVHPPGQLPALLLALGICLATVLTKQHYVVDTLAGMALGGGTYLYHFRPALRQRLRQLLFARLG